jgi:hypothetical protein
MQDGDRCADIDTLSSSSVTSTGTKTAPEPNLVFQLDIRRGVVTLSQIEQNWPIIANAEAWDFNHLTCSSITEIRLIALNVTTPSEGAGRLSSQPLHVVALLRYELSTRCVLGMDRPIWELAFPRGVLDPHLNGSHPGPIRQSFFGQPQQSAEEFGNGLHQEPDACP